MTISESHLWNCLISVSCHWNICGSLFVWDSRSRTCHLSM